MHGWLNDFTGLAISDYLRKHAALIGYVVLLIVCHTTMQYQTQKDYKTIVDLRYEVKVLKFKSLALSAKITQNSRRSQVERIVKASGLEIHTPNMPVIVIE